MLPQRPVTVLLSLLPARALRFDEHNLHFLVFQTDFDEGLQLKPGSYFLAGSNT
jgi:hypothetical protein